MNKTGEDLGITDSWLYGKVKQNRIDRGYIKRVSAAFSRELRKVKRSIRELENEGQLLRRANALLGNLAHQLKGSTPSTETL